MLSLGAQKWLLPIKEFQMLIVHCCYDTMVIPSISSYTELQSFVTELQLPMLVSLELDFHPITCRNVLIFRHTCHQRANDWSCGIGLGFTKISHGFVFVPGGNRVLEMLQDKSLYNLVPGTAVCLTNSNRKRNRIQKFGVKIVIDTTYKRMLNSMYPTKRKASM
jgi:hypothetical protein